MFMFEDNLRGEKCLVSEQTTKTKYSKDKCLQIWIVMAFKIVCTR